MLRNFTNSLKLLLSYPWVTHNAKQSHRFWTSNLHSAFFLTMSPWPSTLNHTGSSYCNSVFCMVAIPLYQSAIQCPVQVLYRPTTLLYCFMYCFYIALSSWYTVSCTGAILLHHTAILCLVQLLHCSITLLFWYTGYTAISANTTLLDPKQLFPQARIRTCHLQPAPI